MHRALCDSKPGYGLDTEQDGHFYYLLDNKELAGKRGKNKGGDIS